MLDRLRNDFRLSLIILLGVSAIIGITPFIFYRFADGDLLIGIVDTVIVLALAATVTYAWLTGDTARTGIFMAIFNTTVAVLIAHLAGLVGLFWLYVVFLSNFFLVSVPLALTASGLALVAILVLGIGVTETAEVVSFLTTASIISLFAYIFTHRTDVLRGQLEELATIDPLTGVGNRRMLEDELEIALASQDRHHENYGLMMLDLDHFKTVNDRFGHATGDRILREFANIVTSHTRRMDRLFRFGGEEFVLLLPETDEAGLTKAARHLGSCIRNNLHSPAGPITVSIGAAILHKDEDWERWLRRADHALYQAKDEGRNRAIFAEPPGNRSAECA